MLIEILALLNKERTYLMNEMADILNTDTDTLKVQMEYLEKLGYVRKVRPNMGCKNKCMGCSISNNNISTVDMWELA
ncbi:FeoC-like transcriptional regulator [Anaerovorax odorimutans]|uniref:FeoC-like transcriptional regulator n=1 Tax=Anaerovorax odorimutans TaxID=109327 RepID=UPI000420BC4A|nr:FeoC-like transcriptional regulator [Anaerovorax odorimutans]